MNRTRRRPRLTMLGVAVAALGQGEWRRNRCGAFAQPGPEPAGQRAKDEQCSDDRDAGEVGLSDRGLDRPDVGVQHEGVPFNH
jgi:hypothetical protein